MKRIIVLILAPALSLVFAAGFADAPREPLVHVTRKVVIANANSLSDYAIVAFSDDYSFRVVGDDEPLAETGVVAVPLSLAAGRDVPSIDLRGLVENGRLKPAKILNGNESYVFETPGMAYNEEITYAITALCNGRVFFQPAKKLVQYSDNRDVAKEYIPKPVVRRYRLSAVAESVEATSQLADKEFPDRYHPVRAFDGVADTGWSEGSDGPGLDQGIRVVFTKPVTMDKISFMPGWFQAKYFKKNNRIKTMEIVLDAYRETLHFADAMTAQDVSFKALPGKKASFRTAQFLIKEVYPGTDWNDTPLAEIAFSLGGEPILVDCTNVETHDSLLP